MNISLKLPIRYRIFNHCNTCHPKTLVDAVSHSSQKAVVSCDTIKLQYSHCKTTKFCIQDQQPLRISGESWKKLEKKLLPRCKCLVQRTQTCSFVWVILFTLMRWSSYPFIQFSSVTQSCPTLCNLMDYSMPGFPVHHQLPKPTQIHVHWIGDAFQPSRPLSSPSPPTFNLSQNQDLFKWVSSSHQVAKVLELQLQHQTFQWMFRIDFL